MARWAQAGAVEWIGVRPSRGADVRAVPACDITEAGLIGDRSRAGKRAVTLVQAEHLPVIASFLGGPAVDPATRVCAGVDPATLRRNLVVRGLNLAGLRGRDVRVGSAVLRITVICAPCSQMERIFGHGGYAAVRGHGGWCAEVVQPGHVAIGDRVCPVD